MRDKKEITRKVKQEANRLGFPLVGITTPETPEHFDFYREWCASGYHGMMGWMASKRAFERRSDPKNILPECESILMLGSPYPSPPPNSEGGKIATYAGNQDYHEILGERLKRLVGFLEETLGEEIPNRWYTDTGPVLERDLAQRAGLGWIGKNTTLINKEFGSTFFLAEILLGIKLDPDPPFLPQHCGTCTLCLDACPTGSLTAPYTLDASRCISYLTIEYREMIPLELRHLLDDWIFGCDICQQVCPWNQLKLEEVEILDEFLPREELSNIDLVEEMKLSQDAFSAKFKNSPIKRAKRRGYLRNIAVALGNQKSKAALPVLAEALQDDEPLIRGQAAWALGEIGGKNVRKLLAETFQDEENPQVKEEILRALDNLSKSNLTG
jgi:epoxyqueuosine reductase